MAQILHCEMCSNTNSNFKRPYLGNEKSNFRSAGYPEIHPKAIRPIHLHHTARASEIDIWPICIMSMTKDNPIWICLNAEFCLNSQIVIFCINCTFWQFGVFFNVFLCAYFEYFGFVVYLCQFCVFCIHCILYIFL